MCGSDRGTCPDLIQSRLDHGLDSTTSCSNNIVMKVTTLGSQVHEDAYSSANVLRASSYPVRALASDAHGGDTSIDALIATGCVWRNQNSDSNLMSSEKFEAL